MVLGLSPTHHGLKRRRIDNDKPPSQHMLKMSTSTKQNGTGPDDHLKHPKIPFIVGYFDPKARTKDSQGRSLDDVLAFSDNQISRYHDFIQYLFPLPEESMVNYRAPLITKEVYEAFRQRKELRLELRKALQRMLDFYGFTISTEDSGGGKKNNQIVLLPNFKEKSKHSWRTSIDHNHLRITRIIRCLRVLSCEKEAQAFYRALLEHENGAVRSSTKMFWKRAAERPLWLPPDEPDDDAEGIEWLREVCEANEGEADAASADDAEAKEDVGNSDGQGGTGEKAPVYTSTTQVDHSKPDQLNGDEPKI